MESKRNAGKRTKSPSSIGKDRSATKRTAEMPESDSEDAGGDGFQLFAATMPKPPAEIDRAGSAKKRKSSGREDSNCERAQPSSRSGPDELSTTKKGLLGEEQEVRSFSALGLERWIVDACDSMGLKRPTDVQWNCIPVVLQGKNVLASAQTGSGKTAAFALPILQLLSHDPFGVFALVLTPTRELAFQIRDQFVALGTKINLRESVIVGGLDMMKQAKELNRRPHVVIATPGRLCDHVKSSVGVKDVLRRVKFLVLDEADRLLEACFEPDLEAIFDVLPSKRTTLLFSATITANISQLQSMSMTDCFQFAANNPTSTVDSVREKYCHIPIMVKDCYLVHLIQTSTAPSIIVFVATRKMCQYVYLLLQVCRPFTYMQSSPMSSCIVSYEPGIPRLL